MGVYDASGTRPRTGKRRAIKSKRGVRQSGSKRANALAMVAFVVIAVAVGISVFPSMFSRPDVTISEELVGVWVTRTEPYADRSFEISPTTVLFRTGTGETDFTFHEVVDVERDPAPDGMAYTFIYADGLRFSFVHNAIEGFIRLANQREIRWTKQDATPTTIVSLPPGAVESGVSGETESLGEEAAAAQQPVDSTETLTSTERPTSGEPQELIREVFSFQGTGRDPFVSLMQSNDIRPFHQDLQVTSITYDVGYPSRSVAVLRDTVMNKAYPVRVGDEIGRLRVVGISPGQVVLVMDEFGTERQVVLTQRRRR